MNNIIKNFRTSIGLLTWCLIRHKFYIPAFIVVQILLAVSVIYGFSFISDSNKNSSNLFLCTGAVTINILAVTCVLAPQIINESKQTGVLQYQKTLPIPRVKILLSDLCIWGVLSFPGIFTCLLIASLNFHISIYFNFITICSLMIVIISLILLGFMIAYIFPSNIVSLMTQIMMIAGLLFSPILYSAEKLPYWILYIHSLLPFVPSSNIIKSTLFHLYDVQAQDYIVVIGWAILSFVIVMFYLTRRK